MLAKKVDRIMVGFEESRQHYPNPDKVIVTGTPVRGEFAKYTKAQAKRELGMDENEKLVVSVWGSLGAGHMNEIMTQAIPLLNGRQGYRLLHAAGKMYYANVCQKLSESAPNLSERKVEVKEYIFDMPRVMAAADLILCRAGASTISELTYMGKPVIMVPSPNVTNHHQERNARVLEKAGGAKVLLEGEFDAQSLLNMVQELLSDEAQLEAMSKAMRSLAVPDATDKICNMILDLT
jgi:UDP-N-acetylglucosamine--N-acetylmuramyl-(pentapeptide) pyrophosphoryl-undecaprenol N-acetylglucosamine transferase